MFEGSISIIIKKLQILPRPWINKRKLIYIHIQGDHLNMAVFFVPCKKCHVRNV